MSSVKKKLVLEESTSSPSPSKKFRFFTPPRFLSVSPSDSCKLKQISALKESILKYRLDELTLPEEIEMLLVAKCGLAKAMLLFQALCHVPAGFPQRLDYVLEYSSCRWDEGHFS